MHLAREIALRTEYSGPLSIIRSTLVYGISDPHNGYGPNRFIRNATQGKDITLFGEGEERRDHVDVEDVAELVCKIVFYKSKGIINAVSGNVASFREVAEFVVSTFQENITVVSSPRIGPIPHNGYRSFDNALLEKAFPNFRFRSWREGIVRLHQKINDNKFQSN